MALKDRITQRGSTLVITIVTATLIGTILCSYLVLITSRNQTAMRATAWNSAIPVLEAGIEEALTHINRDANEPTANQWIADQVEGRTVYWKSNGFPDGSYFLVTNFNVGSPSPFIRSAGYVRSPLNNKDHISRLVQVNLTNPPSVFSHAIAASGLIQLGGSAVVDGYDSSIGPYSPLTNRNANGDIATDSMGNPAINVSGASVFGHAVTGPGGTVSVSGTGSVGDMSQTGGIQSGWTNDNMNVYFSPNAPPSGTTLPLTTTQVGPSNLTYLTADRSSYIYSAPSFVSNNAKRPMIVTGNCTLWVTDDFTVTGSGYVYIAPGASLKLYMGGGSATISGGGVVNGTGSPLNFSYYGLPSNTNLSYSGQANFVGTVNAPQAHFRIGGINDGSSVFGAIICNTFTAGSGSNVHYDVALRGGGKLVVNLWREL